MIRWRISYGDHGTLLPTIPILHHLFQAAVSRIKLSIPSGAQLFHSTIQAPTPSWIPSVRATTCWVAVDHRYSSSRLPPLGVDQQKPSADPTEGNLNQDNAPNETPVSRVPDAGTLSVVLVQHEEWEFDGQVS
ncbi:hypothetical protein S83_061356 [Arachis hypogaea]